MKKKNVLAKAFDALDRLCHWCSKPCQGVGHHAHCGCEKSRVKRGTA